MAVVAGAKVMEDMTWQEVKQAAAKDCPLILPVGSIEQHGPHLPLSTDVIIPYEVAKAVSIRADAIVAPPIRYAYYSRPKSGGGEGYPGTTSLSAPTLIRIVEELVRDFIRHGFQRFLVLNGHYENIALLPEGVERAMELSQNKNLKAIVMNWSDAITPELQLKVHGKSYPGSQTDHAAVTETSLMLFLRPDLVRMDRIPDEKVKRIVKYDIIPPPSEVITKSGSLWSATPASKEKGEMLFEGIVSGVSEAVRRDLSKR